MAFPRNSLRAFMQYARINLEGALKGDRKVNIVVGNQSADLDSFTSSVLYAYLKSSVPPAGAYSPVYIPLLNIPAGDIILRTEFKRLGELAGFQTSKLLNLDDVKRGFKHPDNTRFILVDHNRLTGVLGKSHRLQVEGAIDHHEDEDDFDAVAPEPKIIETAGSCTSLVVRYCRPEWDALSNGSLSSSAANGQDKPSANDIALARVWDAQLAKLALASILIDTDNLRDYEKVEDVDKEAVEYLETKIQKSPDDARTWNRDEFFHQIRMAKQSLVDLTLTEILRKDYKEWTENGKILGISSVVKPLAFLVIKGVEDEKFYNFEHTANAFMTERNLSVFAVMTAYPFEEWGLKKELLIQALEPAIRDIDYFCSGPASLLRLEKLKLDVQRRPKPKEGEVWRDYWKQGDLRKSRKQLAPMLCEALRRVPKKKKSSTSLKEGTKEGTKEDTKEVTT